MSQLVLLPGEEVGWRINWARVLGHCRWMLDIYTGYKLFGHTKHENTMSDGYRGIQGDTGAPHFTFLAMCRHHGNREPCLDICSVRNLR